MPRSAKPSPPRSILLVISGVCQEPHGPGGWGYVTCDSDGVERMGQGANPNTTANRTELLAAIEGLRALGAKARATPVRVVSASRYLVEGAKGKRERSANTDLWAKLDAALRKRPVTWEWEPPNTMLYQVQAYQLARLALKRALQSEAAKETP